MDIKEVRYLTDDRDEEPGNELVISIGNDGDYYISVVPKGEKTLGRSVRLCGFHGGGASDKVPGLVPAILKAFEAIASAKGDGIIHKS